MNYNMQADKLIICFLEQTRRCRVVGRARTIGNRVRVKSSSRVRISPSPPKRTVHLLVGCSFSMRDGEIRIKIEHPSGMFICQCEHWQILLFFLWKNANGYSPSPPEKSTCKSKCFFQRNKSLSGFVNCGAWNMASPCEMPAAWGDLFHFPQHR